MSSFVDRIFTPPRDNDPLGVRGKGRSVSDSNGVDLGHIVAMLQGLMLAQEEMRKEIAALRQELKADIAAVRQELKAEIAAVRAELKADIESVREELRAYHHTVVGHGILITELDTRTSRIEAHLNLPPIA